MTIYILRHGETDANKEGLFQGWVDYPLNDLGRELACLTGQGMLRAGLHLDIAYSSSLCRARQTAELVLQNSGNCGCPVVVDDRVKEICLGIWEAKRFRGEGAEVPPELTRAFFECPEQLPRFPEGESVQDVMHRTQEFLAWVSTQNYGNVLVATHGCALRCMLNGLYENPGDFWHGHVPYNCSVSVVEASADGLRLVGDDVLYYDKSLCVDRYGSKG